MSGKQMEGDNRERRRRARGANRSAQSPSEAEVTLGASKQREHQPHSEDHETRLNARYKGKRDHGSPEP